MYKLWLYLEMRKIILVQSHLWLSSKIPHCYLALMKTSLPSVHHLLLTLWTPKAFQTAKLSKPTPHQA